MSVAPRLALPMIWLLLFALAVASPAGAMGSKPDKVETEPSIDPSLPSNALRDAYFGDLHVHTSLSFDSATLGLTNGPDDAYRFARGETVQYLSRPVKRAAPLDFIAVADHAEYLGVVALAADPNGPFAATGWPKRLAEQGPELNEARQRILQTGFSGQGDKVEEFLARELKQSVWQRVIASADKYYQPGKLTTFVAFEWSFTPDGSHYHRNVIFRGPDYPDMPFSALDSTRPEDLWRYTDNNRKKGVDSVTIPHNPNLSNGLAFSYEDSDGKLIGRKYATTRARNERLVEIAQVKGTSETRPELSPNDELSGFELLDHFVGDKPGAIRGSYVREGLGRGLEIAARVGVNPFHYGIVGSSDFHGAVSGTEEYNYTGALGAGDDQGNPKQTLTVMSPVLRQLLAKISASGVAGVWAEQNTRESIFAALKRREAFATSGPFIKVRLFAGWNYEKDLIRRADWLEWAYAEGVPMGTDIAPPAGGAPGALRFLVSATKDPNSGNLDRIQIVKVWLKDGASQEKVFDVAWAGKRKITPGTGKLPPVGNTVDLKTATYRNDIGAAMLAAEWADPEFDPAAPALYYARVIEIPTPRWSTYLAVRSKLPLQDKLPATIQERAWTSPIFYHP